MTASELRKDMKPTGNGNILAGGYSMATGQTLYKQSYGRKKSLKKFIAPKIDLS